MLPVSVFRRPKYSLERKISDGSAPQSWCNVDAGWQEEKVTTFQPGLGAGVRLGWDLYEKFVRRRSCVCRLGFVCACLLVSAILRTRIRWN